MMAMNAIATPAPVKRALAWAARLCRASIGRLIQAWRERRGARPSHRLTRWLFLKIVGGCYFSAFASLWVQYRGLIGEKGILPAAEAIRSIPGGLPLSSKIAYFPTLAWLSSTDGFLGFLCWGGMALSMLLIAGVAQLPVLVALWAFFLSLVTVGQDFLGFQWDVLLLETGFLAVFLAPLRWFPGRSPASAQSCWC